jgi:predicted small integral membrane protein
MVYTFLCQFDFYTKVGRQVYISSIRAMTSQLWKRNSFFSCVCTTVFSCVCLYNSFFMCVGMCLAVQGWNRKEGNVFFFLFVFVFLFFSVIRLSAGHWTALQSRWFLFYESCKFKNTVLLSLIHKQYFLQKMSQ